MQLFSLLASAITLYSLLCFIRIMLSWFPGAEYSKFGRILSQICDPYLNLFKRFTFLRFSAFDFTPVIALVILIGVSTLCSGIASGARITVGGILAMLLSMCWSIADTILKFFAIILVVRLIIFLIKGDTSGYYSIWTSVDRAITPVIFRISGLIIKGRPVSFRAALIISIIVIMLFSFAGTLLINFLAALLTSLPF